MSKLIFCDDTLVPLATLKVAVSAKRTERLNGENTLDFVCPARDAAVEHLNENTVVSLEGDYFDVVFLRREQLSNGWMQVSVECEHASYRLNNSEYHLQYFTMSNTPEAILAALLSGTGFSVGTVEFSAVTTFSLQEASSRRAALRLFAEYLQAELVFQGFQVSLVQQRGSTSPKELRVGKEITVISQSINKRQKDNLGNPLVSIDCGVYRGTILALGDVVELDYPSLRIQSSLRVVSLSYDPYNPANLSIEVGNLAARLENDLYRIETQTVTKEKIYNGTRIGPSEGFVVERSDGKARTVMNATEGISIYSNEGSGLERQFYVDTNGRIIAKALDIAGDSTFGGTVKASQLLIGGVNGNISFNQLTDTPTYPDDAYITQITRNTITTGYVNALSVTAGSVAAENLTGSTITGKLINGGTITGALIRTSETGQRLEIDYNNRLLIRSNADGNPVCFVLDYVAANQEIFLRTLTGYKIKIQSVGANMSIGAYGTGYKLYIDSTMDLGGNSILNVGNMLTTSQINTAIANAIAAHVSQYH